MRPRRFAVGTFVLCFCSAPSFAGLSPIAVYLDFETAPSSTALVSMQREIDSIMRPAGLEFAWRNLATRTNGEVFVDLLVVHFRGSCNVSTNFIGAYSPEAQAAALGSSSVSEGRVMPFSQIECDQIRRYIGPLARGQANPDAAFGRALARVMAHEMYHVFVGTAHATHGIARASHRRQDLVAPIFQFDESETARLREYGQRRSRISLR